MRIKGCVSRDIFADDASRQTGTSEGRTENFYAPTSTRMTENAVPIACVLPPVPVISHYRGRSTRPFCK